MRVNWLFPVPLSKKENLLELTNKFITYGTLAIMKENSKIISLCAGYTNDEVTKLAYISVVATLPEHSGKGYGKLVVQNFVYKAREKGMKAVHLYATRNNISAIKMYESLGFVDFMLEDEIRPEDRHLILYL